MEKVSVSNNSKPRSRENSRKFSPAFNKRMRADLLRALARKASKYQQIYGPWSSEIRRVYVEES